MALTNAAKAGVAIFIGAAQYGIFLIVSEILYSTSASPHLLGSGNETGYVYSVASNYVSDLGANCSSSPCYLSPSAYVFDASVALLGMFTILGAYFLHKAFKWTPATAIVALAGVGALGVGLFPETTGIWHSLFSLIVFLFAGLSAIVTFRFQKAPMSYLSVISGAVTLAALLLYVANSYLGLGAGGMERMIVYPVLFWAVAFGGHLMASEDWTSMKAA